MMDESASRAPARAPARPRLLVSLLAATAIVAAVVALLGGPRSIQGAPPRMVVELPMLAAADTAPANALRDPVVVRSVNGILDATLRVDTATLPVPRPGGPVNMNLRAYRLVEANGTPYDTVAFPGPTFRVRPGDLVRIKLINNLPADGEVDECIPYPATRALPAGTQPGDTLPTIPAQQIRPVDRFPDCFHGSNTTNIHFHGFHVPPSGPADNVLLEIQPGTSFTYEFRIPHNQSPGTHWYHPHKHGSVAVQVANGMSGAFIVEGGGLDSLTRAHNIRERLVAVQAVDSQVNLVDGQFSGPPELINGQLNPHIVMRPGEVQRWRIVNENVQGATSRALFFPQGAAVKMYDVARDGVQLSPVNYRDPRTGLPSEDTTVILAPGNRLDVFVKAPDKPGIHDLVTVVADQVERRNERLRSVMEGPRRLLRVHVQDTGDRSYAREVPRTLPALPPFLRNLGNPHVIDRAAMPLVVFTDSLPTSQKKRSHTSPTRFYIGNSQNHFMQFNPGAVYVPTTAERRARPMVLDQTQTWKVENHSRLGINHPFHIHINPFQVLHVFAPDSLGSDTTMAPLYRQLNEAARRGHPVWLDVVPLPQARVGQNGTVTPGYVIIRQQYADFTGKYVMHCHILGHEERGMMQILEVTDSAGRPGHGHGKPGAKSGHGHH